MNNCPLAPTRTSDDNPYDHGRQHVCVTARILSCVDGLRGMVIHFGYICLCSARRGINGM